MAPQGAGYGYGGDTGGGATRATDWWKRVVAALIDGLILGVPIGILFPILAAILIAAPAATFDPVTGQVVNAGGMMAGFFGTFIVFFILIIVITGAYYIYLHGSRGQTVGKMAMKIKVVEFPSGAPINMGVAAKRWGLSTLLSYLCGLFGIVDVLWPLWDANGQALHDKIANTIVIDA